MAAVLLLNEQVLIKRHGFEQIVLRLRLGEPLVKDGEETILAADSSSRTRYWCSKTRDLLVHGVKLRFQFLNLLVMPAMVVSTCARPFPFSTGCISSMQA